MNGSQGKSIFFKIRDSFWNYPGIVFGADGFMGSISAFYRAFRPFSHIIVFGLIALVFGVGNYYYSSQIFNFKSDVLVEGVVTGHGGLSRINPLIPTNNQLENDLARLVYLPLVRVDKNTEVESVLAKSWEQRDDDGKEFLFTLRSDVLWHDGEKLTADDVVATFQVLKALGGVSEGGITSKQTELAQTMEVLKTDQYSVLFKLEEINPTFFEDISFGVLPKHILDKVSLSTFSWASFNLKPIGTGPFIFTSYKDDRVTFEANPHYVLGRPRLKSLTIVLFETGDAAVEALKNGSIHMLADPSSAILKDLETSPHISKISSTSLYQRYWALYFNLKEDGPAILKDKTVRQAVSSAIDREEIVSKIASAGEEAMGTIPAISWAYNGDATRYRYDPVKARELLDNAGWEKKEIEGELFRIKDDEILRFDLSYLDKYDRKIVAESIKADLEQIGIVVKLDPRDTAGLNEALVATRNFEVVLYGVETPIDPDRIRLWHSEAIEYPGLNISSYVPSQKGAVIGEGQELERVSLLDVALENARVSFDQEKRKGTTGRNSGYNEFQRILMEDCPAVFLYHPDFTYAVHSRVQGIDLSGMTAPEDRYLSVMEWYIQ